MTPKATVPAAVPPLDAAHLAPPQLHHIATRGTLTTREPLQAHGPRPEWQLLLGEGTLRGIPQGIRPDFETHPGDLDNIQAGRWSAPGTGQNGLELIGSP
ncbi:hypothetical protein [Deinococcus hopiensis]|uniref:Uncharacterized protein n=1 Tax=Deinococcus hopiensis KR-140 TaxID=695939 RepID=A0A1W1UKN0_9DEIO|nr:hypothetical protein [Deinococcus hopiensis]SMB81678.1 hypothetical protein SAMN00790413_04674 [Deinococcus hopiensis KR-140]